MNYYIDMFPLPGRNHLLYYLIRNNIFSTEIVPFYLTRSASNKEITLHELSTLISKQYLNTTSNETIDAVSKVLASSQIHKFSCIVDDGSNWFHIVTPITDPISTPGLVCRCKDYSSIVNKLIENKMHSLAEEWLEVARSKGFSDVMLFIDKELGTDLHMFLDSIHVDAEENVITLVARNPICESEIQRRIVPGIKEIMCKHGIKGFVHTSVVNGS